MDILNTISDYVLHANKNTDRVVGFEIALNHDESSSMYGETVYNILLEGEIDAEYYAVNDALIHLSLMRDTYV